MKLERPHPGWHLLPSDEEIAGLRLSSEIQRALEGAFFAVNLLLKLENGVEKRFGARRAAGNVNVDGNDLIAALHDGVIVEDAAGGCASAHGNDPLGLRHLVVKQANDGSHFLREAAGDNHQIGLARRGAENFCAKTRDVKSRRSHGQHFNGAAGEAKTERPDGAFARPVDGLVKRREDDAFVFEELPEIVGLGECDVLPQGYAHLFLVKVIFAQRDVGDKSQFEVGGLQRKIRQQQALVEKASDTKHNFAKLRAGFKIGVSGSGFRQGEDAIDNGLEAAGGDEFHYRVQFGLGAHVRAEERKLAAEQEAEIKLGIVAGRCPARDQTASWSETGEALFPGSRADVFENDVDAALASDAANFLADFLRFVVDHVIGAKLLGFLELFVAPGRGDDARAEEFGDLYRGAADTAPCSQDEHVFAGLQLGPGDEHVPGGLEDERNRSSFFERQIFRVRQAIYFRGAHEFSTAAVNHVPKIGGLPAVVVQAGYASAAFAAANQRSEDDLLADASRGYIRADLSDLAGDVAAGNVRQRNRHVGQTAPDPQVEVIQRTGFNAHEHLVRADGGVRCVRVPQDVRPAVLVKNDCFHETSGARLRARKVASMEKSVQNAACIDTDQAAP